MTTFARIIGGFAVDIQVAATVTELAARFHPDWLAKNTFYVVLDGTLHGCPAIVNPDGSTTCGQNPIPQAPILSDLSLAKDAFIDYCSLQFGNAATGPARFGAIIVAARGSTDPTVSYAISKYDAVAAINKTQAQKFFQAIRAANLPAGAVVSAAEITTIVTNWPQG